MHLFRTACLALGLGLAVGPACAQSDTAAPPLPPVRPATEAPPAALPAPVETAAAVAPAAARPLDKRAAVERADAWFNSFRVMSGTFSQVASDGSRSQGRFWISKPGKMRFEYAPPSPVELVADGRSVAVRDRKLNTQDLYLIGQTPLRFLLADKIDLIGDSKVVDVISDAEGASVIIEEKSSVGGSARIQLVFSAPKYALTQWTITDAQGYDTTVNLDNVDMATRPDNKLFFINEVPVLK
jgi:outer membrane lipoprotein-sorting protein